MTAKKLSILVPTTTKRRAFWPWLGWNIRKQVGLDWSSTEVVVACEWSSMAAVERHIPTTIRAGRFVPMVDTATIGEKRQALLRAARGEYVAWFDDDDWQHPERLQKALQYLTTPKMVGVFDTKRHYLRITEPGECELRGYNPVAISFVGKADEARAIEYRSTNAGEDTHWMYDFVERYSSRFMLVSDYWTAGLYHGGNTTEPILSRWRWPLRVGTLADRVGRPETWGDTDEQLHLLRERLGLA